MYCNKIAFFSLLILIFSVNNTFPDSSDMPTGDCALPEKQIVVVIPSFNNLNYYKQNIDSVMNQKYSNYYVIYIDDCSSDGMSDVVAGYIEEHDQVGRWIYVRNPENCGAMYNLYYTIHACPDTAIIVTIDGDDWFKHDEVLARVNREYADEAVWLTYGQFEWKSTGKMGYCRTLPFTIRKDVHMLRKCCGYATHLRTFYAWLFKKIHMEDLLYEGKFFPAAWDRAMMAPMLEMASPDHFRCIDDVLYVYNDNTSLNDHTVRGKLQWDLGALVFTMPPYEPLDKTN